ncbi:unnamed protein product [Schistosoma curassoni]|uniref:Secreted protein n=1 Tax=Schistosoma curassoni TaxID=6186 RepID=A0A183K451_9TREM|nr:unnamed protein product [Schistosoma curassoni]
MFILWCISVHKFTRIRITRSLLLTSMNGTKCSTISTCSNPIITRHFTSFNDILRNIPSPFRHTPR